MTVARPPELITTSLSTLLASDSAGIADDVDPVGLEPFELRCPCGDVADSVHLLPYFPQTAAIVAACPGWDPGGYWFALESFWADVTDWAGHLARKSPAGWQRLLAQLLEWESAPPAAVLDRRAWRDVLHAGQLLVGAAAPSGPKGERDLVLVDVITRGTLYRGRVDPHAPYARTNLARLLRELRPGRDWIDIVNRACNMLAERQLVAAVTAGLSLDELRDDRQ